MAQPVTSYHMLGWCLLPYHLMLMLQEADNKLTAQIRSLDEGKKELARLTDALLQKT